MQYANRHRVKYADATEGSGFSRSEKCRGTPFTHVYDKFQYYLEDMDDCISCGNYMSRGVNGRGCPVCEFQDLKDEAIKNNRIKRPRGWARQCLTV
jgi:hypothetical protein